MSRYFTRGQGVPVYTHLSDQHSTVDTKMIVATAPQGLYVLDGHLGNATDLHVVELDAAGFRWGGGWPVRRCRRGRTCRSVRPGVPIPRWPPAGR
ncbi:Tn3 family transposase [Streptomyces coeruleorubidus]